MERRNDGTTTPHLRVGAIGLGCDAVSNPTQADSPGATSSGNELRRWPAFVTTHWSVVLTAGRSDSTRAQDALARLCQTYWYPLYAYVRRRGYSPPDAEDLTQEFFARLLRANYLGTAQREKGRFRWFLLSALNHFLANEWDRARAKKRGGGNAAISLNADAAESRYKLEPADTLTAERIYERRWALTLLDQVLRTLQREYELTGKKELFDELSFCLTGERSKLPYAELAARLGLSEANVKVAVHRLRKRYRELLRAEIANTVSSREEVEDEIRHLFDVLAP
jgi:RNA polymerase sigma-70 factor (ECF subfamily)